MNHHVEVCTLSCQDICPYPLHYRMAFAFSTILCPRSFGSPCGCLLLNRRVVRVYHVQYR